MAFRRKNYNRNSFACVWRYVWHIETKLEAHINYGFNGCSQNVFCRPFLLTLNLANIRSKVLKKKRKSQATKLLARKLFFIEGEKIKIKIKRED